MPSDAGHCMVYFRVETMTTKPVKNIKITKDGKVKTVPTYRDASAAIRAKKSTKQQVVRKKP